MFYGVSDPPLHGKGARKKWEGYWVVVEVRWRKKKVMSIVLYSSQIRRTNVICIKFRIYLNTGVRTVVEVNVITLV